jgi:hypothetical protein
MQENRWNLTCACFSSDNSIDIYKMYRFDVHQCVDLDECISEECPGRQGFSLQIKLQCPSLPPSSSDHFRPSHISSQFHPFNCWKLFQIIKKTHLYCLSLCAVPTDTKLLLVDSADKTNPSINTLAKEWGSIVLGA